MMCVDSDTAGGSKVPYGTFIAMFEEEMWMDSVRRSPSYKKRMYEDTLRIFSENGLDLDLDLDLENKIPSLSSKRGKYVRIGV